jgi:hypothetical protein
VHRIAMHRSRPGVLFMQKHWDFMRSDDAGDNWHEISGNLPTLARFTTTPSDRTPRSDINHRHRKHG